MRYGLDDVEMLRESAERFGLEPDHHSVDKLLAVLDRVAEETDRQRGCIRYYASRLKYTNTSAFVGPFLKQLAAAMSDEALGGGSDDG